MPSVRSRVPYPLKSKAKRPMKDVMIDLETLGTTADAVILSIGAVKFNLESGDIDDKAFYASVSVESNLDMGRRISESTLNWWFDQTPEARQVFREPKQTLENSLRELIDWFEHDQRRVWSNGADFDLPMLAHAFTQLGLTTPWQFWNSRCVRTYRALPAASSVPKLQNDHNALRDAVNQAKHVQAIYAAMVRKVPA